MLVFFFFFFSSRRRHTRSDRDWSSDRVLFRSHQQRHARPANARQQGAEPQTQLSGAWVAVQQIKKALGTPAGRSEERRVGKECRSRGWEEREEKKERRVKEGE